VVALTSGLSPGSKTLKPWPQLQHLNFVESEAFLQSFWDIMVLWRCLAGFLFEIHWSFEFSGAI
jgi:hypothetical protein